MKVPLRLTALIVIYFGFACSGATAESATSPFAQLEFEAARKRADADGRLLLVDFGAEWCIPCKRLEKEVFSDPSVQRLLEERAITAIRVDIDKYPSLAKRFNIEGVPLVLAFKPHQEAPFDMLPGYVAKDKFIGWLQSLCDNKRTIDTTIEKYLDLVKKGQAPDRQAAFQQLFEIYLKLGEYDKASEYCLLCWRDEPLRYALADSAQTLAQRYPPFAEQLEKKRALDSANCASMKEYEEFSRDMMSGKLFTLPPEKDPAKRAQLNAEFQNRSKKSELQSKSLQELLLLNSILSKPGESVRLYLMYKDRPLCALQTFMYKFTRLEKDMRASGDWTDLADCCADAAKELRKTVADLVGKTAGERAFVTGLNLEHAVNCYAAYLAVGKDEAASEIARLTIQMNDTPAVRTALIDGALEASQPRAAQLDFAPSDEIKAKIEQSLKSERKP